MQLPPDFLSIGHLAKDLTPDGHVIGGAVTYASLTARALGLRPAMVTSFGPDVEPGPSLADVLSHVVPSPETTTFKNVYERGRRTQTIVGVGGPIAASDVPEEWRSAPLVLLGPLAGELDKDILSIFTDSVVMAAIQGWLRRWDEDGRVSSGQWNGDDILPGVDAAILSEDDISDRERLDQWKDLTPVLIFTRGARGAELHYQGRWNHIDAFPVDEVDPTGAGDVFAAAYLVRFRETGDPLESARFAGCAASFCVEKPGVEGIASRARVEARLAERPVGKRVS